MTFTPGTMVRFKNLRGPRMMVMSSTTGVDPGGAVVVNYSVVWFDRNDNMLANPAVAAQWLEAAPIETATSGPVVTFPGAARRDEEGDG